MKIKEDLIINLEQLIECHKLAYELAEMFEFQEVACFELRKMSLYKSMIDVVKEDELDV